MSQGVYAYPRFRPFGLGNMLFPWARCELFAKRHNAAMIAPQWTKPKLGPLLRRERDWRYYTGIFDSRSYVHGPKRLALLALARKFDEDHAQDALEESSTTRPKVVVFRMIGDMFLPLLGHRDFLRQRLLEILREPVRQRLESQPVDWGIAVHIRRGDMRVLKYGEAYPKGICVATSLDWFIGAVRAVRRIAGSDVPVRVFSDGKAEELAPLLALPNVSMSEHNPAIVDIFLLSRSPVVITTCGSTFSGWACYLGEPVSLWYPDSLGTIFPANARGALVTALDGCVRDEDVESVRQALTQGEFSRVK